MKEKLIDSAVVVIGKREVWIDHSNPVAGHILFKAQKK